MKNRQDKILQFLITFQGHDLKAYRLALGHIEMSTMTHVAAVISQSSGNNGSFSRRAFAKANFALIRTRLIS